MRSLRLHITLMIFGLIFFTGCSTHYFFDGSFLVDEGAFTEAAAQFERARKGSQEQAAIEA